MNNYKCYVYKGVVWQITDGLGNSFYDCIPISDYLSVCEKDKKKAEKQMYAYYEASLEELKSGKYNKSYLRELNNWELQPLLIRLSNSDSFVFIDDNAVNNVNCKRCSFKRYDNNKKHDILEAHIISQSEKEYIKEVKDNIVPFVLTKNNLYNWFRDYGDYKISSNSDSNIIRRIYRDSNDFYSNGILFLEQLINMSDESLEKIRKPAWIQVRDQLSNLFVS